MSVSQSIIIVGPPRDLKVRRSYSVPKLLVVAIQAMWLHNEILNKQ